MLITMFLAGFLGVALAAVVWLMIDRRIRQSNMDMLVEVAKMCQKHPEWFDLGRFATYVQEAAKNSGRVFRHSEWPKRLKSDSPGRLEAKTN